MFGCCLFAVVVMCFVSLLYVDCGKDLFLFLVVVGFLVWVLLVACDLFVLSALLIVL